MPSIVDNVPLRIAKRPTSARPLTLTPEVAERLLLKKDEPSVIVTMNQPVSGELSQTVANAAAAETETRISPMVRNSLVLFSQQQPQLEYMLAEKTSGFDKLQMCQYRTNAFGKMEFSGDETENQQAKYLRLSDSDDVDKVVSLMVDYWNMLEPSPPSLVISVVGGAKNFHLDGKKKDIFTRGLIKAAETSSAWIITSGFHTGINKDVGDAVREGQSIRMGNRVSSGTLKCIGIAHWGYVQNRDDLILDIDRMAENQRDDEGYYVTSYKTSRVVLHGHPVSLDPNHTHFLLVDDGYRNKFRSAAAADFRSKLESKLAATPENGKGAGIPVVLLLVEGGKDSFKFVAESVGRGVPVVICQGTGRAADILAYAYNRDQSEYVNNSYVTSSSYEERLTTKMASAFGGNGHDYRKELELVRKCCQTENLITVFNINTSEDLDLAILSALLQSQDSRRIDQLTLALKWNRSDVAADQIFSNSNNWNEKEIEAIMFEALLCDKVEFVKLMLQNAVIAKDYLTVRRLRALYIAGIRGSKLNHVLNSPYWPRHSAQFTLRDARRALQGLFGADLAKYYEVDSEEIADYDNQTRQDDELKISDFCCDKPYNDLFLWAVLLNKQSLAKFFWERVEHPIIAAIAATKIYESYTSMMSSYDSEGKTLCTKYKHEFETLAMDVLDCAFKLDQETAMVMMERSYDSWGGETCLTLAAAANDKRLLATACCQMSVGQTWARGLKCSNLEILIGVLFFPFVLCGVRFDAAALGYKTFQLTMWYKLKVFFSAPGVKFCFWNIFYVLYLLLFSYVLMFDFKIEFTWPERVLHIWAVTIFVEKLALIAIDRRYCTIQQLIPFRVAFWKRMDFLCEMLHGVGFILRCLSPNYFEASRVVFCLTLIVCYMRLFRSYMASSYMGPKLFVIRRMMTDVFMFIAIVLVFMIAYAVAQQSLQYDDRPFYWDILLEILTVPYWQMMGDKSPLGNALSGKCNVTGAVNCPRDSFLPVTLLTAVYMFLSNILLVNLLIAIFSHVFDEVQSNALEIWKYEMYTLADEFDKMPVFPPPIGCLELLIKLYRRWSKKHRIRNKDDDFITEKQRENLKLFERECLIDHLHKRKEEQPDVRLENRIKFIHDKVEIISDIVEDNDTNFDFGYIKSHCRCKCGNSATAQSIDDGNTAQITEDNEEQDPHKKKHRDGPSTRRQLRTLHSRIDDLERIIRTFNVTSNESQQLADEKTDPNETPQ